MARKKITRLEKAKKESKDPIMRELQTRIIAKRKLLSDSRDTMTVLHKTMTDAMVELRDLRDEVDALLDPIEEGLQTMDDAIGRFSEVV